MEQPKRIIKRYSMAFKQKVVSELESGKFTVSDVRRLYDITGGSTIDHWRRKLGKSDTQSHVVRIEMKDERDKLKALEVEKRKLESALAQAHLKIITLESTIKVLEEERGSVVKKNSGTKLSRTVSNIPTSDAEVTP
jgi:transposase-like protein